MDDSGGGFSVLHESFMARPYSFLFSADYGQALQSVKPGVCYPNLFPRWIEFQIRQDFEKGFKSNPRFYFGQKRTQTIMGTHAKSHVSTRLSLNIKTVWVWKMFGIAIARSQDHK